MLSAWTEASDGKKRQVKFREEPGTGKNTGASAARAILPVPGIMPEYRPVIKYRLKTDRQRPVQLSSNNNKGGR